MIGIRERPAAPNGDEARVTVFGEDRGYAFLLASACHGIRGNVDRRRDVVEPPRQASWKEAFSPGPPIVPSEDECLELERPLTAELT